MDENLRAILNREKLEHILDLFLEQGVTDSILRDFTDSDLRELGVNKIGERMRLLSAFKFDPTFPSLHSFVQPSDSIDTTATQGSMINVKGGILPADSPLKVKNVSDFEIAKHTVTMEKWHTVRSWALSNKFEIELGAAKGLKCPITMVSWYDTLKWCNAKSLMDGLEPVYAVLGKSNYYSRGDFGSEDSYKIIQNPEATGYRLPCEGEWEWAASGGLKSQGYIFSGSNNLDPVGWYRENANGQVHPVGEKLENELGLYDMSGNVWEWCWDANYSGRRIRGGCWSYDEDVCAVSFRRICFPDYRSDRVGFRVARTM